MNTETKTKKTRKNQFTEPGYLFRGGEGPSGRGPTLVQALGALAFVFMGDMALCFAMSLAWFPLGMLGFFPQSRQVLDPFEKASTFGSEVPQYFAGAGFDRWPKTPFGVEKSSASGPMIGKKGQRISEFEKPGNL